MILTISLTEFTFNKIAILCLGVWGGSSHISEPLNKCLENCFEEMKKVNISSVAMTDYNE